MLIIVKKKEEERKKLFFGNGNGEERNFEEKIFFSRLAPFIEYIYIHRNITRFLESSLSL